MGWGGVRQCLIPWGKEFGYYQQSTGKALGISGFQFPAER